MDERHWWFASKLQETFHFGGYDNPTLLEDFLSEPDVVDLINDFLAPGEPCKLFFYCNKVPTGDPCTPSVTRSLHVSPDLTRDVVSQGRVCLYVLRRDMGVEVDISQMEKELYCGELRHSVLSSLASLLTEAYSPLLHSQRQWGECSEEGVVNFLQNFDKFSNVLLEIASRAQIHQPLLQRPVLDLRSEIFHQTGKSFILGDILVECESLVADWGSTIESVLIETTDERLEDPSGSPLSELNKWQRRQTLLSSVVEQLRTKECRAVIALLVAAKSRLLKKWKNIDLQITDAFNNARDRVRYLETLSPHLEALQSSPPPSPSTVVSTILPALVTSVRQMEGLSRAYARSGYLGVLFTKISNALVQLCIASLESYTFRDGEDHFWSLVPEAITSEAQKSSQEHPLIAKLNSCLHLMTAFKELLHQLKDTLLQQHVNFGVSATSVVGTSLSHSSSIGRKGSNLSNSSVSTSKRVSILTQKQSGAGQMPAVDSAGDVPLSTSGITLQNVDRIAVGLNDFGTRVSKLLEIISTLAQFKELQGSLNGLPRIAGLWDLGDLEEDERTNVDEDEQSHEHKDDMEEKVTTSGGDLTRRVSLHRRQPLLSTLAEESVESMSSQGSGEKERGGGGGQGQDASQDNANQGSSPSGGSKASSAKEHSCSSSSFQSQTSQPTSRGHSDSPGDSVALIVNVSIRRTRERLESACSGGVLDVFSTTGKNKSTFPAAYNDYSAQISTLEENVCLYLRAVFAEITTSKRALEILARFRAVSSRVALKEALKKCALTAFSRYSLELEEIQNSYERNKGSPPVSRNAPLVAGAVGWTRELLRRVEGPMEAFRRDSTVMQSVESLHVCKLYNRLATALLQYETLWLGRWRGSLEQARARLRATLLVQESSGRNGGTVVRVNCHQSLLELIAESKALAQMKVPIPESAKATLNQESRIKYFKQQLEDVLGEFYSIREAIDPAVRSLLAQHVEAVMRSLLPGWTTLTWSTLNIDAFLHQARAAVASLGSLAGRVGASLEGEIYQRLKEIRGTSLFDVQLASQSVWHPQEFSKTMLVSVAEKSTKILENIAGIRAAVIDIITITSGKTPPERTSSRRTSESRSSGWKSKGSTPQHSRHWAQGIASQSGTSSIATQGHLPVLVPLDETSERVLSHFCELVFNAVSKVVLRSHKQLCGTLGGTQPDTATELKPAILRKDDTPGKSETHAQLGDKKAVSFQEPLIQDTESEGDHGSGQILHPQPPTLPLMRLVLDIQFSIPRIQLEPGLEVVHSCMAGVSQAITDILKHVTWWTGLSGGKPLHDVFEANGMIESMQENILQAIQSLEPGVVECLRSLHLYDFLWQRDLHASYQRFLRRDPQHWECSAKVEQFLEIEGKISDIPSIFLVGPLQLSSEPIKNSLKALAVAWKTEFASFLHSQAKVSLGSLVSQREAMLSQLSSPVESLPQLRAILELLQSISDLQNTIDSLYLPVEGLYSLLREYHLHLPRGEVQQVDSLREEWRKLTDLAEKIQYQLLSEQRLLFEREVDKQVKGFVVETIQFRNSFDTEGPLVPGLVPSEAVARLGSFLEHCEELKSQRDLLGAVQRLLNIPHTSYPELDQTEQDLSYLRALYGNYQQFLSFDKRFRQELWAEVGLDSAIHEVEGFWMAYQSLPVEQQEWDASQKLRAEIHHYRKVLPLLQKLHSKEIRNRHWLQVMAVVNCTFQLEGSVFKMAHLLDAGLMHHVGAIEEIVHCARCESELETHFYNIEEEWSEQVLHFLPYKSHGPVLLAGDHTHFLLEQLEHAQMQLATMLMSRHIAPLKEEAAQWAMKLASVAEILQQWLSVQSLWHSLEAVFSNAAGTASEFPDESVRFAAICENWGSVMRRAHETKHVLQCCLGGEVPKSTVLSKIGQKLEECKKSLTSYLLCKRQAFPRFYYVSDDTLLGILSNPVSIQSLQPHLGSLFAAVRGVICTPVEEEGEGPAITAVMSPEEEVLQLLHPVHLRGGVEEWISELLSVTQSTLQLLVSKQTAMSLEESAYQNVAQVASMAMQLQWTRDTELALSQCRYDRRAIPGARARFSNTVVGKLSSLLMRNGWRVVDEPLSVVQRAKLESMAMLSLWLRDILDDLCHRKLRDVTDFEWQRFLRPCLQGEGERSHLVMRCLDIQLSYGYEYLGCQTPPVFTPRTDNYFIAFTQAMAKHLGSVLVGPTGSGKMQLIKGVGMLCGRFVLPLHCSSLTDKAVIARTFEGLAQDNSWACFSDVHTLKTPVLSIISQMMHIITAALQSNRSSCHLPQGREVPILPEFAVFFTHTPHNCNTWQLPPTLFPMFRTFSLTPPDSTIVFKTYCTALGLRAPKALANKLVTLYTMVKDQLSAQASLPHSSLCHVLHVASWKLASSRGLATKQTPEHGVGAISSSELHSAGRSPPHEQKFRKASTLNLSPSSGQPLPPAAQREHSLIAQLILNLLGPRFADQELPVFVSIVKDVFAGSNLEASSLRIQPLISDLNLPLMKKTPAVSSRVIIQDFSSVDELLREEVEKAGLVPSKPWSTKVEQLFSLTTLKHAVVVAGKPATGKSAALATVVSALNAGMGESTSLKLLRVYPGIFEDLATLFGRVSSSGDWVDGIFTSIFRKANKATQTVTWVCFDGPLQPTWVHFISELIGSSKMMTLPNGEHLFLNEKNLKVVFETGSLKDASPSTFINCGVVHFDSSVLSWRTVVKAWLATRKPHEALCLQNHFETVMDPVVEFVLQKSSDGATHSEVGLLESCLAYLTTLLNTYSETAEVFSDVHVERLLLFSVIWSYGGVLLRESEQKRFSQLLKSLTNSMPDDDSEYSVFDYYVDESGEWDIWKSRIPEQSASHVDLFGSVFVDTADTIRVEVLLELALMAKRHILLVGPHGCGKTTIARHFLYARALNFASTETVKQLVFSGHATASTLHRFMQVNFHHRQGYTYGPKHGKKLQLFIDDLHLPLRHSGAGCCTSHEYLRQLVDSRGLYNLQKENEWCGIEDLLVCGALTSDAGAFLAPRLRRHLAIIHTPDLKDCLKPVTFQLLVAFFEAPSSSISPDALREVLNASLEVYSSVKQALKASNMPGRQHYFFSLANLESVFQGICNCLGSSCGGLSFGWKHEVKRAFVDGLCRMTDADWLVEHIDSLSTKHLHQTASAEKAPLALSGIPTEIKQGGEQPASTVSPVNVLPDVALCPISQWSDLHLSLGHYLMRYREEQGALQLELSGSNIQYLVKLHRALKFPRGNCTLVGSLGQPLELLASFALYIAGYTLHHLDTSTTAAFSEGMRALFRQAGLEGKPVAIIFSESDLASVEVVQTVNSIVACGELPMLFSNDEMDGLLQALAPAIKRDFPSEETDPLQYFTARIYRNLRILLCLTPSSPLLHHQAHDFPGLWQGSHVIWMQDWGGDSLGGDVEHFFAESPFTIEVEESLRTPLYSCLSAIHHFMMCETGQLVQAGLQPGHFTLPLTEEELAPPPSAPSSFQCLMEKVLSLEREMSGDGEGTEGLALPYVGPRTHLQFLECFCEIFRRKNSEAIDEKKNLSKALETLHETQQEASVMKQTLSELKHKHEQASQLSQSLLAALTTKACQLERVRALLGRGSSVLSAMQMVGEQERQLAENEEDDEELLAVFMDGLSRRSSRLEILLQRTKEQLVAAEEEEREAHQTMVRAKEQAHHWHGKIDRNTIDQIKSLNSPPRLVGTIMELILTLLHQYGVGDQTGAGHTSISDGSSSSTPGHAGPAPQLKKRSSRASFSHSSTSAETSQMDREQWGAIQLAIGDSQKFLDLLNSLKWEEGLSTDAVNLIESKLATSTNSSTSELTSTSKRASVSTHITIAMARHAAESTATMCAFAVAIVDYTHSFKPFKLAAEKLQRAKQELYDLESSMEVGGLKHQDPHPISEPPDLADVAEEGEMGEEDVGRLEGELRELQAQFDHAVMEKHSLSRTCQQLAEKLKSANHLLENLKGRQESWQSRLEALPLSKTLVANCILAAALTTYCGPLRTSARHGVFGSLVTICQSHGLPPAEQGQDGLLKMASYPTFMMGEPSLYHLVMEGLPQDPSSQQIATITTHPHPRTWPLLLDPLNMAELWLREREGSTTTRTFKSPDLHEVLLRCMTKGSTLVLTEVDTRGIGGDRALVDILCCRRALYNIRGPQKIVVGGKEVECHPDFRLYLVTSDPVGSIPAEVFSLVTPVLFHPERRGLEELLLDHFLRLHNPKTSHERQGLREEIYSQVVQLQSVEGELLWQLAQEARLEEPKTAKNILSLNKAFEDAHESLTKAMTRYAMMNEVHLATLRALASQASVVMDVVCAMRALLPAYHSSYSYVQSIFLAFVEQAGSRIQGEDTIQKMTHSAYSHFLRGYFEKDQLLFSLTLALELESARGRASCAEREFLISPTPGRRFVVRGLLAQPPAEGGGPTLNFGKKPFDWMTDTQWQMLLMLASQFSWSHEVLERLNRDGKETLWRTVAEGIAPETINLAEGTGYRLLPIHQLLLMRAMRPERVTQCISTFITAILEHRQRVSLNTPIDLHRVAKGCRPGHIPLLLSREDPSLPPSRVQHLANKTQVPLTVCYLHGVEEEECEMVRQTIERASSEGHWVLLHNLQASPSLLSSLPSLLAPLATQEGWRLWLSVCGDCELPSSLLQRASRVVVDSPKSVRASVLHSLSSMAGEVVGCSSRPEWLPLLHNVTLLHATIRLRGQAYPHAWAHGYHWNHTHLVDTVHYLVREFKSSEVAQPGISGVRPVSWSGMRHMIAEVFYGSAITDSTDSFVVSSLTEHWVHPGGPRREVGRYHTPSTFFFPSSRLGALLQAVETACPPLVFTAELCGLYYTPVIQLGWESYLFPQLSLLASHLEQHMPPHTPPTPKPGIPQQRKSFLSDISLLQSNRAQQSSLPLVEKLPSFINVPSQISEVNLAAVPRSLLRGIAGNLSLLRELPLQKTVEKLLESIPTGWRKEVLVERQRRHGADTPLGLFLRRESSSMAHCLQGIHISLQELQRVLSDYSLGDTLHESPHLVDLSLSLLILQVPHHWSKLVGSSSPPETWPLREWIQDLVLRFAFLDRVLIGGLAKTPTYWLGAFFDPKAFLGVVLQNMVRSKCEKAGAMEQLSFHAELTNRDKDHIRDPPPEGELFVYGVHLWGCGYEKTATLELQDVPPKSQAPVPLPVLHLSLCSKTEQSLVPPADPKAPQIFHCPCFFSHSSRGTSSEEEIFVLEVSSSEVTPAKWATRNLACTLRPF